MRILLKRVNVTWTVWKLSFLLCDGILMCFQFRWRHAFLYQWTESWFRMLCKDTETEAKPWLARFLDSRIYLWLQNSAPFYTHGKSQKYLSKNVHAFPSPNVKHATLLNCNSMNYYMRVALEKEPTALSATATRNIFSETQCVMCTPGFGAVLRSYCLVLFVPLSSASNDCRKRNILWEVIELLKTLFAG